MLGNPGVSATLIRRLAIATDAPFVGKLSPAPRIRRMSPEKLKGMTDADLVKRFVEIAIAQDHASLRQEISKYNHLYGHMEAVVQELRSRQGDQRRALLALYDYTNAQVRLKAAVATLAVAPEAARRELEKIAASKEFPQAGDAGMTLSGLDDGTFKPT